MTKTIEVSGRTEDEAIESALEQLNLSRDDVSVEIVERAKTGFLGLKNTPAVVKVHYEDDTKADVKKDAQIEDKREMKQDTKRDTKHETKREAKEEAKREAKHDARKEAKEDVKSDTKITTGSEIKDDRTAKVGNYLTGLFERMGINVKIDLAESEGAIDVSLTGDDPGALIGRRGETLDAIQHLTNYMINRGGSGRIRVNIDAENYRQRRNETLESLAVRTAGKVIKYRRNVTLDPMNAFERHVIHAALQEYDNISTYSVGSEPNRRIVVAYSRNNDNSGGRQGQQQYREWS